MSYITVPEASQLTAGARDQIELFAAAHGHFSALRAVVARFPAALGALDNQYSRGTPRKRSATGHCCSLPPTR
jgi:hypothetical protein